MKKVEEQIKKEVVDTHVYYEAIDGTIFKEETECRKYEESAIGVLLGKTAKFTIAKDGKEQINSFDDTDENNYKMLLPQSQEDIDVINQIFLFPRNIEDYPEPRFTEEHIGKLILMGYRMYDHGLDWSWFHELDKVIDRMTGGTCMIVLKKSDA